MRRISFLLVCEGSSDAALVSHLEELCLLSGATEVSGVAPNLALVSEAGHSPTQQLRAGLQLEPAVDLIFVHRDSDSPDGGIRRQEILTVLSEVSPGISGIPLVPVQETEAWILLDEPQIRRAADNPNGKVHLEVPSPERVEAIAHPKELLFELLRIASELSGRRLGIFNRTLRRRRRRLVEELRCEGLITRVPSWQRLRLDIRLALTSSRSPI